MLKRFFDIFVSIGGLIFFCPLLIISAFAIVITNGRPVLFRQWRIGKGGKEFMLYKFRTMSLKEGSERGDFDAGAISRVTGVGSVLRQTKIDELPQLYNVLRGEMSIVGPRPEVKKWVDEYPERWGHVHSVLPGITDPASIVYRNEEKLLADSKDPVNTYRDEILPHKLDLYEQYIGSQSFFGDIKIVLQTIRSVFKN